MKIGHSQPKHIITLSERQSQPTISFTVIHNHRRQNPDRTGDLSPSVCVATQREEKVPRLVFTPTRPARSGAIARAPCATTVSRTATAPSIRRQTAVSIAVTPARTSGAREMSCDVNIWSHSRRRNHPPSLTQLSCRRTSIVLFTFSYICAMPHSFLQPTNASALHLLGALLRSPSQSSPG